MSLNSFLVLILLLSSSFVNAQNSIGYDTHYFGNPVGHKIVLAGSFGELRNDHFHAGLDIKPLKPMVGEPLYAVAEGFISRIKMERSGYGRVLYIDHPNGYTSVYAHMDCFSDSLEQYLIQMQYELESFEVDIYLKPSDFKVVKGEIIGNMGSTGRSYGPHLHFEIRETVTEDPINPMLFGIGPEDHRHPLINSLAIHSLDKDMVISKKYRFGTKLGSNGDYRLNKEVIAIPAWNIGVAVHSFDKMDGANNTNGIYSLKMFIDDSLQYSFDFEKLSFSETNQINAHIDYKNKIKENSTYQRLYKLPGNSMNIYDDSEIGRIKLFKDKIQKIRIEVTDLGGNVSTLRFGIKRDVNIKQSKQNAYNYIVDYGVRDTLIFGHVEAIFEEQSLYSKSYISCNAALDHTAFSIGDNFIPLNRPVQLIIRGVPNDSLCFKRCIVLNKNGKKISYGGEWDGKLLRSKVKKLGAFEVIVDTLKPTVRTISFPKKIKLNHTIKLEVFDDLETKGDANALKINAYIDGDWQLFQYSEMKKLVKINLKADLKPGNHKFLLTAEDDRGNIRSYRRDFEI